MQATRRTVATIASIMLSATVITGCTTSSNTSSSSNAVTGSMILTLEDDHGDATARETLTVLQLPLPGLGASQSAPVEWAQLETRATSDWAAAPVAFDEHKGLALVAGETGVTLVHADHGHLDHITDLTTNHPIASVSLSGGGLAAALSEDGNTFHLFIITESGISDHASFPIAIALGEGSHAIAALLNHTGQLAVLDAGRSRVAILRTQRSNDGTIAIEKTRELRTGRGLTSGTWSPDGKTLVIAERLLDRAIEENAQILTATGRLSFITAETGETTHTSLPGLPKTLSFDRRGNRLAVVMDQPKNQALALIATGHNDAALLDWAPLPEHAAGVSFDARGKNLLVALPELGALSVWTIDGATLRNTDTLVDTGPGVSAVAVAGE